MEGSSSGFWTELIEGASSDDMIRFDRFTRSRQSVRLRILDLSVDGGGNSRGSRHFRMGAGWHSSVRLQKLAEGTRLAADRSGEIDFPAADKIANQRRQGFRRHHCKGYILPQRLFQ